MATDQPAPCGESKPSTTPDDYYGNGKRLIVTLATTDYPFTQEDEAHLRKALVRKNPKDDFTLTKCKSINELRDGIEGLKNEVKIYCPYDSIFLVILSHGWRRPRDAELNSQKDKLVKRKLELVNIKKTDLNDEEVKKIDREIQLVEELSKLPADVDYITCSEAGACSQPWVNTSYKVLNILPTFSVRECPGRKDIPLICLVTACRGTEPNSVETISKDSSTPLQLSPNISDNLILMSCPEDTPGVGLRKQGSFFVSKFCEIWLNELTLNKVLLKLNRVAKDQPIWYKSADGNGKELATFPIPSPIHNTLTKELPAGRSTATGWCTTL